MHYILLNIQDIVDFIGKYGGFGIVAAVGGLILAIIKDKRLATSIANILLRRLEDRRVLSLDDFTNHNLKIKIGFYLSSEYDDSIKVESELKKSVFINYSKIVATVFQESVDRHITYLSDNSSVNLDENSMRVFIQKETIQRNQEIDKRFVDALTGFNADIEKARKVNNKIRAWRNDYLSIISKNADNLIVSGKFTGTLYKMDSIFHIYNIGLDVLFINGLESFNKLNGELDNFLNAS